MKNKNIQILAFGFLVLLLSAPLVHAKSAIVGDIILLGDVQRSGHKLVNDASVFEGDSIRTEKRSGGVIRVAEGRVEIGESSEIEVVRQNPLKIVLKAGTLAVNFPKGTPLEIVTPQLEVHPSSGEKNISAVINAIPQMEDRFQSRSGDFTVIERQKNGKTSHIMAGQIIVAALLPAVVVASPNALEPIPAPQGPLGGMQIATLDQAAGDVRIARAATPNNFARVAKDAALAANDFVRTLNGRATVKFTDNSVITLIEGTTIKIAQQVMANTITRRISQYVGSMWFNITRSAGTQTTLETPTAVAAIRGTQGTQDVPNEFESTHALNEGLEQITESVTSQSVTLRAGQQVRVIKGIGFGTILSLTAAIAQPLVAANQATPGQAQNGLTAQGTGIATTSTITTIAVVSATAVAATVGIVAAVVPVTVRKTPPADGTSPTPLNPPGGG
jgi:hypothetical protein